MGAEREDSPPLPGQLPPHKKRTDPGIGPSSEEQRAAEPVDFEALSAALGPAEPPLDDDGYAYEDDDEESIRAEKPTLRLEPVRVDRSEKKTQRFERGTSEKATIRIERPDRPSSNPKAAIAPEGTSDSSGRSSANYASAQPHALNKSYELNEDPSTPAVIVASNDTVPSAPPKMTVKLEPVQGRPPSGPYAAAARSAPPPAQAPSSDRIQLGATPSYLANAGKQQQANHETSRMPERPRRGRTPTIVVRARGPSRGQKLFAFMAMLVLFTAGGILAIMYLRPQWLGLGMPEPSATQPPTQVSTPVKKP